MADFCLIVILLHIDHIYFCNLSVVGSLFEPIRPPVVQNMLSLPHSLISSHFDFLHGGDRKQSCEPELALLIRSSLLSSPYFPSHFSSSALTSLSPFASESVNLFLSSLHLNHLHLDRDLSPLSSHLLFLCYLCEWVSGRFKGDLVAFYSVILRFLIKKHMKSPSCIFSPVLYAPSTLLCLWR